MIDLVVLRHFETIWNKEKRLQGHMDLPLLTSSTTLRLPKYTEMFSVVSSPLKRTVQTAQLLGLSPKSEDALKEMDYGEWQGQTTLNLNKDEQAKGLYMTPPGGESPKDVMDRLLPWIQTLTHPTVAITHKGIIRAMLSLATGWDMTHDFPEKIQWNACHHFKVHDGCLNIHQLNIPLEVTTNET